MILAAAEGVNFDFPTLKERVASELVDFTLDGYADDVARDTPLPHCGPML